ncbi:MAG: ATP-dependent metallopeptidase FtsH/Yme1/Tma family protein, partial [Lachnospiraceae bacterium]|nr:ATP-dependent metallopeptidase FtsH/Yme1/Tma family protein [Lachnospiraceae bacterium]
MRSPGRSLLIYFIIIAAMLSMYYYVSHSRNSRETFTYNTFEAALKEDKVEEVNIRPSAGSAAGEVIVMLKDDTVHSFYVTDVTEADALARSYPDVVVNVGSVPQSSTFATMILPIILVAALMIFFFVMMNRQAGGGGANAQMMNFGKSRARMTNGQEQSITFKDVAGLVEEKQELEEIVDFLKDPARY